MGRRGGAAALCMTVFGALMLAVGALAQQSGSVQALTNCTASDSGIDGEEQAFLTLINSYRTSNGLTSLNISPTLSRAAAWMSRDLGVNAYFSHTDSLGRSPSGRAADCGYPSGAGENIAGGTAWSSAQTVFDGWKASPGHNANMLNGSYRVIGIGRVNVPGSPYGWYWTTPFGVFDDSGAPPPTNTPANTPTNTPTAAPTSPTSPATQTPTPAPTSPPTSTPTSAPGGPSATATPTSAAPTSTPTATATGGGSTATPTRTPTTATTPESGATKTPAPAPEAAKVVPLASGANLIAWPSTDRTPTQAFGASGNTISIVYAWDPASGSWRRYGPSLPGYLNNLALFRKGDAYWVIAKTAGSVTIGP